MRVPTYTAAYQLAARPYALAPTPGVNTRTQLATLFHGAAATKEVRLRRVWVAVETVAAAGLFRFDLVRLTSATTPTTGNPAITPTPANAGQAAAEATCLALPTTAGTEAGGSPLATVEYNLGITGVAPTVNPPVPVTWWKLYDGALDEVDVPTLSIDTAGGYAVVLDVSVAASTPKVYATMEFTEA